MADASVDAVVCFYSIHHMVGARKLDTIRNVSEAMREFGRVLKPDGCLFVFEMTPMMPFLVLQHALWNLVRRAAPRTLDMYFFSATEISRIGAAEMPKGTILERIFFGASAFTIIPPIFSLPWLKLPRLLYPLDAKLYKWRKPYH
jgi:SAM-dependent methyltransferase